MSRDEGKETEKAKVQAILAEISSAATVTDIERIKVQLQNIDKTLLDSSTLDLLKEASESLKDKGIAIKTQVAEQLIEKNQQEISNLKDNFKSIEQRYGEFESITNNYIKEKEEETKKLKDIRERIEKGENIPQHELDTHIKSPEQIKAEQQTIAKARKFHKDVNDHHVDLTSKIDKLSNQLQEGELTDEQRASIHKQLGGLQEQLNNHIPIVEKTNKQMQNLDKALHNKGKERENLDRSTNHLPDDHPHRKFVRLIKEQHEAVATGNALPLSPERQQALDRKNIRNQGQSIQMNLTRSGADANKGTSSYSPAHNIPDIKAHQLLEQNKGMQRK